MTYLIGVFGLIAVASIYMLFWNNHVYRLRIQLLKSISAASKADIHEGCDYEWRYDAFNEVSYEQMLARPWRRPLSLYRSLAFTEPAIKREPTP